MVQKLINQSSNYDLATISGLAFGVDQLAHKYSLENNIPTIAVLGG
jgi:DNA processing protein